MKRGFSLMELSMVILVMGIISTLAFPGFSKIKAIVYQNRMKNRIKMIVRYECLYYLENGKYMPENPEKNYGYYIKYPNGKIYSSVKNPVFDFKIPDNKYLYYVYWYENEKQKTSYCYVLAYASVYLKNDIDGDETYDYWYSSTTRIQPRAIMDDLKD